MTNTISESKTKAFLLSEQVKAILKKQGFTSIFNYKDYEHFKRKCRKAFDKATAIAELFIADAEQEQNDFNEYIF